MGCPIHLGLKCCDHPGIPEAVVDHHTEHQKYTKVWESEQYRNSPSPGEAAVARGVLQGFCAGAPASIGDFGCGAGAAWWGMKIWGHGFQPLGVDIVDTGLTPLIVAPLWDLPQMHVDYGFCVDVMEHIPPEYVRRVINGIMESVKHTAYFQIAMFDDVFGPELLGQPLHLSVHDEAWWRQMFASCLCEVETSYVWHHSESAPYFCAYVKYLPF